MVELVPILIKKRKANEDGSPRFDQRGQPTPYPDLLVIPHDLWDGAENPGALIRRYGGWHTNQVENLETGAPFGQAMCLVPPAFAQAMLDLTDSAEALTLAEAEDFCDKKCYLGRPALERDASTLQGLLAERELRISHRLRPDELDEEIARALNPDDPAIGVRRHPSPHSFAELQRRLEEKGAKLISGR